MFDDTGVEICHPNKEKIGKKTVARGNILNLFKKT